MRIHIRMADAMLETRPQTMLETMAMSLKAEVDDSKSDSLSQNALRKADTIEKLARMVKETMKLNVAQ